jgi:chorismate dehydratase
MKLGLLPFLNTQPLEYGFRTDPGRFGTTAVIDVPSRLAGALLEGKIDTALISSVEVLRHPELTFCKTMGVCADSAVRSILYIRSAEDPADSVPDRIWMDEGSRTSQALLLLLLKKVYGASPERSSIPASDVPSHIGPGQAGMLIGDAALSFWDRSDLDRFRIRDLGQWWNELEGLPFVFAVWAYPKSNPVPDETFEWSLSMGLSHMEEIIQKAGRSDAREYLTKNLHYRMTERDLKALTVYRGLLAEAGLL